jgi:hypothetical protein
VTVQRSKTNLDFEKLWLTAQRLHFINLIGNTGSWNCGITLVAVPGAEGWRWEDWLENHGSTVPTECQGGPYPVQWWCQQAAQVSLIENCKRKIRHPGVRLWASEAREASKLSGGQARTGIWR